MYISTIEMKLDKKYTMKMKYNGFKSRFDFINILFQKLMRAISGVVLMFF